MKKEQLIKLIKLVFEQEWEQNVFVGDDDSDKLVVITGFDDPWALLTVKSDAVLISFEVGMLPHIVAGQALDLSKAIMPVELVIMENFKNDKDSEEFLWSKGIDGSGETIWGVG